MHIKESTALGLSFIYINYPIKRYKLESLEIKGPL